MRIAPALFAAALVLAGCGQTRRYGDEGGQPVAFAVHLERAFVNGMPNRQWRPSVGVGAAVSSSGYSSVGTGVGFSFSSTRVYLLGGDGPAEAQVFIQELSWGDNDFSVRLTPGRTLHLTVKAEGGREGWESLGQIVVPRAADARVAISLATGAPRVTVTSAETAKAAAPAAPAQTTDGGPAIERVPPSSSPTTKVPPPGEHPDAGDKPPTDKNPPLKIKPGPSPGTPPAAAPAATPATPYPDPSLDQP